MRILRGLVSHGLVGQNEDCTFYVNVYTEMLIDPGIDAGMKHK